MLGQEIRTRVLSTLTHIPVPADHCSSAPAPEVSSHSAPFSGFSGSSGWV